MGELTWRQWVSSFRKGSRFHAKGGLTHHTRSENFSPFWILSCFFSKFSFLENVPNFSIHSSNSLPTVSKFSKLPKLSLFLDCKEGKKYSIIFGLSFCPEERVYISAKAKGEEGIEKKALLIIQFIYFFLLLSSYPICEAFVIYERGRNFICLFTLQR